MKIDRIYIDGFGHFHDADIETTGSMSVISGANEAGKSTLLAFVRGVLFGFPTARSRDFIPALSGGAHGGRITMTVDAGQQYIADRKHGSNGGPLILAGPLGELHDKNMMPSLVGPSPDLFRTVFAFSLDELQDMKSLNSEEVRGRIYSAGVGAANLPSAVRELDANRQAIFAPRGRTHKVATVLSELQETESQLAELAGQASEYGRLTVRREQVREELESIATRRAELSSRESELQRMSRAWEEWTPIRLREEHLATLPEFENFPESAVVRLEGIDERIEEAAPEVDNAQAAVARAEAEADKEVPDEDLVSEAMEIESIRRGRDSFDSSVHDLPERVAELGADSEKLASDLRDLGPEWDEARLEEFDSSMVVRDEADQLRERLAIAEQTIRDRTTGLEQAHQDHQDALRARQEAQETFDSVDQPAMTTATLQEQRRHLRAAKLVYPELNSARQRREDLEGQIDAVAGASDVGDKTGRSAWLPISLILGGLAAAAIGVVMDGQQAALALGVVLVVAGVGAVFWTRSTQPVDTIGGEDAMQAQRDDAASKEQALGENLQRAAELLGIAVVDSQPLGELEETLDGIQESIRRHEAAAQSVAGAERLVERHESRAAEARDMFESAETSNGSVADEWRGWLTARGLAETLTPNTFIQLLGRVETARAQHGPVVQMRGRVKAIERNISLYRDQVGSVAQRHGTSLDGDDDRKVSMAADDLIRRLDQARAGALARENAVKMAEDARERLEAAQRRLNRLNVDRDELIAAAGAADAEDLRRRASQHEQRRDAERQIAEDRVHLQRLSVPGQSLQALVETLTQTSLEYLREELATVKDEIDTSESRRSDLDAEGGSLKNDLARMATDEAASELRARRESLLAQLKLLATEWSKLTIAATILQRTRQKYEQERQPGVIRHAQEFFASITGGRYTRVFVPADQPSEVFVESANGSRLDPAQLSRGTREQLYLALRFGLIREFGERAERLPVIVDEVLVNFDPDRQLKAAEAFAALSETNQVLVFTCHPEMVDLFTKVSPGAQVIDLDALA